MNKLTTDNRQPTTVSKLLITLLLVVSGGLLVNVSPVLAQEGIDYKLLEPIPQLLKAGSEDTTNTAIYIQGLVKLMIAIATGLAVIMLIFAGIKYMSTDAFGVKEEAKGVIENALWGLFLAMSAWIILNTINPKLVTFDLSIEKQDLAPSGLNRTVITPPDGSVGGTGGGSGTGSGLSEQDVRRQLSDAGVGIVTPYAAGLQQKTIDMLKNLKASCGSDCEVVLTSGTAGVHNAGACSHANGWKVDLRVTDSLSDFITTNYQSAGVRSDGAKLYKTSGGTIFARESNHWDVAVQCQ